METRPEETDKLQRTTRIEETLQILLHMHPRAHTLTPCASRATFFIYKINLLNTVQVMWLVGKIPGISLDLTFISANVTCCPEYAADSVTTKVTYS